MPNGGWNMSEVNGTVAVCKTHIEAEEAVKASQRGGIGGRSAPTLFTPIRLGAVEAPNRLVMAPLTRDARWTAPGADSIDGRILFPEGSAA